MKVKTYPGADKGSDHVSYKQCEKNFNQRKNIIWTD